MRRILLPFLAVLLALTTTTFAGMAFFGMEETMVMDHGTCMGAACDSMPGATSGADCLNHCLSAIPQANPTAPLSLFITLAAAFVAFIVSSALLADSDRFVARSRRWREGIGKLLLQQSLSTVVLRN